MNGSRLLIYLLFFASGMSGLVYEVVWVRQFGLLFGSTVYSAALVTSIYMLGLGVGSYLAGRWVDRRVRSHPAAPVRAYGLFEIGIALLAGGILLVMPHLAELAARASSYVQAENGWYRLSFASSVFRYGCAALLLSPITLLMGGTLTLLIRHLVGNDVASAGRHVGVLYGINTAGAALGCLLTDTAFVPAFGLQRTQLLAIGLNLFAAAGALVLAQRLTAPPTLEPQADTPRIRDPRVAWAGLAIGLTGFAAMAMQILWFRHLISLFGGYRPVFSILLTVILIGIWLGALLGGLLTSRTGRPGTIFVAALAGFVVWSLGALWSAEPGMTAIEKQILADPAGGPLPFMLFLLRRMAWVVGPPALLSGMAFPLANALVQRVSERVGERAGLLYLSNTFGGVTGSLLAGFWLLPGLGIQHTATLVAGSVLLAIGAISLAARGSEPSAYWLRGGALTAGLVALVVWAQLPDRGLLLRTIKLEAGEELVAAREGINETIAITDREGISRRLLTNGHGMSSTSWPAQRYMRAFVHVPMLLTDEIENVMLMCFGVGNTANSVLVYPTVKRLDVVDLSADILEHARYFEPVNGRPLEDPRVRVHVNDGRQHLRMNTGIQYDLITGEPPPIAHAGVASLYTRDFYELAKQRLRPGGFITYWLPMDQVGEEVARQMVAAFVEVFPNAILLSGFRQQLMLVGRKDAPFAFDPERMRQRIAEVPGLWNELRWISLAEPVEVAASFAASAETMGRATAGHPALSDDRPSLEYGSRLMSWDRQLPGDLFSLDDVATWCPRCMGDGLTPNEQRELQGALEIVGGYYRSAAFLKQQPGQGMRYAPSLSAQARQAAAASLYLQQLSGRMRQNYLDAALQRQHGKPALAAAEIERLVRSLPDNVIARIDLADLYLELGRPDLARVQLEAARERAPRGPRVQAAWRRFRAAEEAGS